MSLGWLLDAVVITAIVVLAVRVLLVPELIRAVVLFISLGLFVALAWVRLLAPDIALAEAAVGAGITGVLLLHAVRSMPRQRGPE